MNFQITGQLTSAALILLLTIVITLISIVIHSPIYR